MIKKAFLLIGFLTIVYTGLFAQKDIYTQRDIDIYQKEATQLVDYFEYTLNLIGSSKTLAKEKDIIINQSFLKIFLNENVQIEDDLDEYRTVPTNKNVQAYLKDIDFFFKNAEIKFSVEDVDYHLTENNQLYFKFQINRNLCAKLINGDSINTNKIRFIEINFNDKLQELKIASIYTTKLNEKEELMNWWNSTPDNWKQILGKNRIIPDSVFLRNIISFTDSAYTIFADSLQIYQLDSLVVNGIDTLSYPLFDSVRVSFIDTVLFDPEPLYDQLRSIVRTNEIDLTGNQQITDLSPLSKLTGLTKINISNTRISDLTPLRNLTKLESLDCSGSQVESIFPLRYLNNLRILNLNRTAVTELSPLSGFSKLEQLYLNATQIDSLHSLAAIASLKDLRFSNTIISDLNPLINLKNLEVLHFDASSVNSVDALKNLENLRILVMDNTRVDKLDPLSDLTNLKQIFCDNSLITPAEANQFMKLNTQCLVVFQSDELIAWWEKLNDNWKAIFRKYRNLDENPTKAQLHELIKIKIIDISKRAEIQNLEPLKKLIYLEHLNCSYTAVTDLEPITDLIDLKYLDFSSTNISSIVPLKNLSKLESVYFSATSVSDLSPLINHNYLQQLHCNYSNVKTLEPLTDLTNLKFVYCDYSKVKLTDYLNFSKLNNRALVIFQTDFLKNWWEQLSADWKEVFMNNLKFSDQDLNKEILHRVSTIKSLDSSNDLKLKSLDPLKNLHGLRELIFSGTQISNLQPLENLKKLTKIICANNPISDLGAIVNLPDLRYLDISNIPLRDFEQIQFMTSLETLICPGTQIKSLKYLEYLKNLKVLECYNTNIKNLNSIEDLDLEVLKGYDTGRDQKRVSKFKSTHPDTEVVYY